MESFTSRQRRVKRFHSEPRQGRFGFVQGEEVPAWWDNVQARLVMVLKIATRFKNAAKSHQGFGLRMPTS